MKLNFPDYLLQIKSEKNKKYVFDKLRRKYVVLNPEEWVRQNLIHHLESLDYPMGRISVERNLPNSKKRYDLIIYNAHGSAQVLVECKAPDVPINEKTLKQVASYLLSIEVPSVLLTNGINHFFIVRDKDRINMYPQIPHFSKLRD